MAVHADLRLVEHDEKGIDLAFRADVLRGFGERQNGDFLLALADATEQRSAP
jgi:hypothetical protein